MLRIQHFRPLTSSLANQDEVTTAQEISRDGAERVLPEIVQQLVAGATRMSSASVAGVTSVDTFASANIANFSPLEIERHGGPVSVQSCAVSFRSSRVHSCVPAIPLSANHSAIDDSRWFHFPEPCCGGVVSAGIGWPFALSR